MAELELMNDAELANEAEEACKVGAITHKTYSDSGILAMQIQGNRIHSEASDYQRTIELVARKSHHGTTPQWVPAMQSAFRAEDAKGCLDVWIQVNDEDVHRIGMEAAKKDQQSKRGKK